MQMTIPLRIQLNRRHRVALFLTLLAAGLSLVSASGIQITVGIIFIGVAIAWAFGSNSRLVHALFIVCGLLLATVPILFEWNEHRENSKATFQN